jgi:hypothetical protein
MGLFIFERASNEPLRVSGATQLAYTRIRPPTHAGPNGQYPDGVRRGGLYRRNRAGVSRSVNPPE